MGIDHLKKCDEENYEFILKFCQALGCRMEENRGNLDFISGGRLQLNDHKIEPKKLDPKTNMFLFLINLLRKDDTDLGVDFGLVEEEFPNVRGVLNTLGFRIDG
jgi:hypothetical protein